MARWWQDSRTLDSVQADARTKQAGKQGGKKVRPTGWVAPAPYVPQQYAAPQQVPVDQQVWEMSMRRPAGRFDQWDTMLPANMRDYVAPDPWNQLLNTRMPTWLEDYDTRVRDAWAGVTAPREDWQIPGVLAEREQLRTANPLLGITGGWGTLATQASGQGGPTDLPGLLGPLAHDIQQIPVAGVVPRVGKAALETGLAIATVPEEIAEQGLAQATLPGSRRAAQLMRESPELAETLSGSQFDIGRVYYNLESQGYEPDVVQRALREVSRIAYSGPESAEAAAVRVIHGEDVQDVIWGRQVNVQEPSREETKAYLNYITSVYESALQQGVDDVTAREIASRAEQELKVNGRIPGEGKIFREMVGQIVMDPLNIVQTAQQAQRIPKALGAAERALGAVDEALPAARALPPMSDAFAGITTPLHQAGYLTEIPEAAAEAIRAAERVPLSATAAAFLTGEARELSRYTSAGPLFSPSANASQAVTDAAADITRQAERGAKAALLDATPSNMRRWAERMWGKVNPFELTDASRVRVAVEEASPVIGTLIAESQGAEDALGIVRQFVNDPDSLAGLLGNLPTWTRSDEARKILEPLLDGLDDLPSVKMAMAGGDWNKADFFMEVNNEFMKLMAAADATGPKGLIDYQKFAQNYRGLMSEFYLRTPGYVLRNTISDLVTMANDGLLNLDGFQTVADDLGRIGPTTRRIEQGLLGAGLSASEQMQIGKTSVLGKIVGKVIGEGAGEIVSGVSDRIGGFISTGRIGKAQTIFGEEARYRKAFHAGLMRSLPEVWNPTIPDDIAQMLGPVRTAALQGQLRRSLNSEEMIAAVQRAVSGKGVTSLIDYGKYLGDDVDSLSMETVRRLDAALRNVETREDAVAAITKLQDRLDVDLAQALAEDPLPPVRTNSTVERLQDAAEDGATLERAAIDAGLPPAEAEQLAGAHVAEMQAMQAEVATAETGLMDQVRVSIEAGQNPRDLAAAMRGVRVEIGQIQFDTRGLVDKARREVYEQLRSVRSGKLSQRAASARARSLWDTYYADVRRIRGDEQTQIRGLLQKLQTGLSGGQVPQVADDLVSKAVNRYRSQLEELVQRRERLGRTGAGDVLNIAEDESAFATELEKMRLAFDEAQAEAWRVGVVNPSSDALDIMSSAEQQAQQIGAIAAQKVEGVYEQWRASWGTAGEWTKGKFREMADAIWRKSFAEQANRMDLARHELFSLPVSQQAGETLMQTLGWPLDALKTLSPDAMRLVLKDRIPWDAAIGGPLIPVTQLEEWTLAGVARNLGLDIKDPRTIDAHDWARIGDLAERDAQLYRALSSEEALFWHIASRGEEGLEGMTAGLKTLRGVRDLTADDPAFIARMRQGAERLEEVAASARARQYVGTRGLGNRIDVIPESAEYVERVRRGDLYQVRVMAHGKMQAQATFDNAAEAIRESQRIEGLLSRGAGTPNNWIPLSLDDAISKFGIDTSDPDDLERLIEIAQGRAADLSAQTLRTVDQRRVAQFQEGVEAARRLRGESAADEAMYAQGFLPKGMGLSGETQYDKGVDISRGISEMTDEWWKVISTETENADALKALGDEYIADVLKMAGVSQLELSKLNPRQQARLAEEIGQGGLIQTKSGRVSKIGAMTLERRLALREGASPEVRALLSQAVIDPAHALGFEWLDLANEAVKRQEALTLLRANLIEPGDMADIIADDGARAAMLADIDVRAAEAAAPPVAVAPDLAQGPTMLGEADMPIFSGVAPFAQAEKFAPTTIPDVTQVALPGAGVEDALTRSRAAEGDVLDETNLPDWLKGLQGEPAPQAPVVPTAPRPGGAAYVRPLETPQLGDSISDILGYEVTHDPEINAAVNRLVAGGTPVEEAANLGLAALDDPAAKERLLDLAATQGGMFVDEIVRSSKLAGQVPEPVTYGSMADVLAAQQKRLLTRIQDGVLADWDNLSTTQAQGVLPFASNRAQRWAQAELPKQWARSRTVAVESAREMADRALLSYNDQRRADTWLSMVTPYSYWKTRSARNWAIRLAQQPATLSHYAGYKKAMDRYATQQGYRSRFKGTVPLPAGGVLPDWMGDELYVNPESLFFPFASMAPNEWEEPSEATNPVDYAYRTLSKYGFRPYGFLDAGVQATGLAGTSGMPAEGNWWDPLVSTPQGTLIQAARTLARDESEGPVNNLLGQLNLQEWDAYRIDRMLGNMAGDDPALTQDALLAQSLVESIAMGEFQQREALEGSANIERWAEVKGVSAEELARAQATLGTAWLRMQQEKALPGALSAVAPVGARPFPTGERAQLQMQRESRAAGYDPLTGTGSRAQYEAYTKAHPEAYTRAVSYQMVPGSDRINEETWTPLERRGTLAYQPEKQAALESLGTEQLGMLTEGGIWNGEPLRAARDAHTQAMAARREELSVGEFAWPETEGPFTPLYGSTPEEAEAEAQREVLGIVGNAAPKYSDFESAKDYDKATAAFYAALAAGDYESAGVTLPANLPQAAMDYGKQITRDELTKFWQENDTLAEALVEGFGGWYGEQWDKYYAARGLDASEEQLAAMTEQQRNGYYARRDSAWQRFIEQNELTPGALLQRTLDQYGDRWTPDELRAALAEIEMPTAKETWLARKTPEERAEYEADEALGTAKEAFWDAYWALPEDPDWRSTKGQPLVAFIVDKDTRGMATAEQYQAAAAVLRRYLEDFGDEEEGGSSGTSGASGGSARTTTTPRSARTYYGGGGGGSSRTATPQAPQTWEDFRRDVSGALSRQLSDFFLRNLALESGAVREIEALMLKMGWTGTFEAFLEMLRTLFKTRAAPTKAPKGSYRYRK